MKSINKILDVSKTVKWIGALDYDIVSFDVVMSTDYGTTYNSYFINARKKTIIETTKEKFKEQYLGKIKSLTDPADIEFIVMNHTEPDHSGNLKHLLELAPKATVVGTGSAIRYLKDMIGAEFKFRQVRDGDELDLGNMTLKFIGAPNLHWPDTMYTYLLEEKILFSCDSFGSHYCDEKMFDDLVGPFDDAFNYYFDVILRPYSKFMLKAIEKIRPLEIDIVCPGHGPILKSNWQKYVDLSEAKAKQYLDVVETEDPRVLIAYVSAYGYTREMACNVEEGLKSAGRINTELIDLETASLGELEEQLIRSSSLLVGSPTINQNTLLPVYRLFSAINPIRDKGKPAATFGSYGWSGEAIEIIEANLKVLKLKLFDSHALFKFYPHEAKSNELKKFGKSFGQFVLESMIE
ncbi:MAG: FprA family A-type flavoprotein [Bacteroidota bacterium]|nr:FprA family A-type flavoprotein [Bacteroidota bacterium]